MNDIEKLGKLFHHWREHNMEHAGTYLEWAEKTAGLGMTELSDILTRLYNDAKNMDRLFEEGIKSIK